MTQTKGSAEASCLGPEQVFRYLGRYTHRAAISNSHLLSMDDHAVVFRTRGRDTATLSPSEFIGRFLQHISPSHWPRSSLAGPAARAHGSGCPALSSLPAAHDSATTAPTSARTAASERYFMKVVSGATATQFRAAMATALSAAVIASWRESMLDPCHRFGAPHSRAIWSDVLARATAGANHNRQPDNDRIGA